MQRNFRFLIWGGGGGGGGGGGEGLKICLEGNFVTSAKVAWENRFKIISNHYLNSNV